VTKAKKAFGVFWALSWCVELCIGVGLCSPAFGDAGASASSARLLLAAQLGGEVHIREVI
jgi:hypothetical protein